MSESADRQDFDERTRRDLVRLADGTLDAPRRKQLEARVAASPELAAALARQRSALRALRSLDAPAPVALRARIQSETRQPSPALRRRRLTVAGGLAGALAAVALLAILVLPSSNGGPSVVEAAQLSSLPATQASVPVDSANPKLLAASVEAVPFPNLEGEFGWSEDGARRDELDGRRTETVFYQRGGVRIGYTILAGEAIDPPGKAETTTIDGVSFAGFEDDGKQVVTWLREGRTCVLSGHSVSDQELLELASWTGKGSVPF